MNAIRLSDLILSRPETRERCDEIIKTVTEDRSLQGERMWASLVISGVSLGVEEGTRFLQAQQNEGIVYLHTVAAKIDLAMPQIDDVTSLELLSGVRNELAGLLENRAKILQSILVGQASNQYGIEEDVLMGKTEPKDLDPGLLQYMGAIASREGSSNFGAWCQLSRFDRLRELKCQCTACMMTKVAPGSNERDEIRAGISHFGSIDKLYAEYAKFLLSHLRDDFSRTISGEGERHSQEPINPQEMTKEVIKNLVSGGRRRDDEQL